MDDIAALEFFAASVGLFVEQWLQLVAPGRKHNYYHWLEFEALQEILKHGSVWKYASDVTESFVHILKDTYLHFTTRGGSKNGAHWVKQALEHICIKLALKAFNGESDWRCMISPYERKKMVQDFMRHNL